MYQVRRPSFSEMIPVRTLRYHVHVWGEHDSARAPLVLLHGWMDVGASFQFLVDALDDGRRILAPDWRGFGLSASGGADSFWFPDYLADLDFLLAHYCPQRRVDLLGHSMGGNVAMAYAGIRPERVRRLINVEGFGLPVTRPEQAPGRLTRWLDELQALHRGEIALRSYDDLHGVAARLTKTNPRLAPDKALWLAQHWAQPDAHGRWTILGEAAHKLAHAQLYRVDETLALYRRIQAPTLVVLAEHNEMARWWKDSYTQDEFLERLQQLPQAHVQTLAQAGHMVHHDQPEALAACISAFLD